MQSRLMKNGQQLVRILDETEGQVFVIDCVKLTMPKWIDIALLDGYVDCTEDELKVEFKCSEELAIKERSEMLKRYTLIAGILPFVSDDTMRNAVIKRIEAEHNVSSQTIRKYLCEYLVYQRKEALAPKPRKTQKSKELTPDQKNMRWALNKFFYTKHKNSLNTAYTMMLKEKYCNKQGALLPQYPTFNQFRYFYRTHKNMQTFYISRDGIKSYERNNRPLTGDGIQEFADHVGIGMLDSTICDIYLVDDAGNLVGRPILVACIDAYSSLCMGYSLLWEGGMYSLRNLMLNVIADKVKWCKKFGISIRKEAWDTDMLPATLVTDMGSEYKSENFEQMSDLGVTLINLPSFRPELKGSVEKFFDLIQDEYKKYLKGKGVIEPDYQERGAHDYRKDACLTMNDFEKVILYCIIYYNSQRLLENYPYTDAMLGASIKPYASDIFAWGRQQPGVDLIKVTSQELVLTLLPRTTGTFGRTGLRVNKMRYHADGYTEEYLKGGTVTVAYNPDDVSTVWLLEDGKYIPFQLIESRYKDRSVSDVMKMKNQQKDILKNAFEDNLQAQIDLAEHLQVIAHNSMKKNNANVKNIRDTRSKEQNKRHLDLLKGGAVNE